MRGVIVEVRVSIVEEMETDTKINHDKDPEIKINLQIKEMRVLIENIDIKRTIMSVGMTVTEVTMKETIETEETTVQENKDKR